MESENIATGGMFRHRLPLFGRNQLQRTTKQHESLEVKFKRNFSLAGLAVFQKSHYICGPFQRKVVINKSD